jgi:hypothetical protein
MSTRYQPTPDPISQARYMSSPEFAELRGISGVAVSARAAVLLNTNKKKFIWWLQGMSLAEGGLKRVARELLEMFPDRIGTPAMHKEKVNLEKNCPPELIESVERTLGLRDVFNNRPPQPRNGAALIRVCQEVALRQGNDPETTARYNYNGERTAPSVEEFIVDLCINPTIYFAEPREQTDFSSVEAGMAIDEFSELSRRDFTKASLPYFRDIVGALFEYKSRCETNAREKFHLTAIGKKIWETLDYALASRGMVVLDGLEGRGKTQAVKAWYDLHVGQARFVSLKGIANKTTAFREIAKALGIASSYTRTAPEMQARIEDVLKRSKLLLVIDEAHFLFNQSQRMYSRPELVDWIDTAICNQGVGIALVTTPQFIVCMTRAADQVEWNYRQFRRRVKRWEKLPATNTEADIRAVAKSVFKKADAGMISQITGYALLSKRDLSAVGDVADEVRVMIGSNDLSLAKAGHIHDAIHKYLIPSDKTFLEGMAAARTNGRKKSRKPTAPAPEHSPQETETPPPPAANPRIALGVFPSDRSRDHARAGELVEN